MSNLPKTKWRKLKTNGTYRRIIKKYRETLFAKESDNSMPLTPTTSSKETQIEIPKDTFLNNEFLFPTCSSFEDEEENIFTEEVNHYKDVSSNESLDSSNNQGHCEQQTYNVDIDDNSFKIKLRKWSLIHNITHAALKDLIEIINESFDSHLAKDPRTLLCTPSEPPVIKTITGGSYWHNGVECCLKQNFSTLSSDKVIKVNFNIDGVPLYKNGESQFWPILMNVYEHPHVQPMIVGLFYGEGKPGKVEEFLELFAEEMSIVLKNGVRINDHLLSIKIRAFICDSPARAFIKGTANFNSQNGCLKCCIVGVHSSLARCTVFPPKYYSKRTDTAFRKRAYGKHHAIYRIKLGNRRYLKEPKISPLLKLPIDIVEDVIVADSLHLLHLGITKRLLLAYKEGHSGCENSKWSQHEITQISSFLKSLKVPLEIHRKVRGLNSLCHWKGSECAVFLNYYGLTVLKRFLVEDHYQNFLNLVCATTICSTNYFKRFLPVADNLFRDYNRNFYNMFNIATSNIHNLTHIVAECERFGPLPSISSYPFENHLHKIKNLLRTGNLPLSQLVNRLYEINFLNSCNTVPVKDYPCFIKTSKSDSNKIIEIRIRDGLTLSPNNQNKWFLTKDGEIVSMSYATYQGIYGNQLKVWGDFFEHPIKSRNLNIFASRNIENLHQTCLFDFSNILCKFVVSEICGQTVFVPLHHTYPEEEIL